MHPVRYKTPANRRWNVVTVQPRSLRLENPIRKPAAPTSPFYLGWENHTTLDEFPSDLNTKLDLAALWTFQYLPGREFSNLNADV